MNIRRRGRAAALLGVLVWFATVAAQDVLPTPGRRTASPASAPAVDRGLRAGTTLRAARQATGSFARAARARYVAGSVIVKFKRGTSAAARAALLAVVDGRATTPLTNAPF